MSSHEPLEPKASDRVFAGHNGYLEPRILDEGRARGIALVTRFEPSTANLVAARYTFLDIAQQSSGPKITQRSMAASMGIELLERAQLEPGIADDSFGEELFSELIQLGEIADSQARVQDALKSRLLAVTLALRTSLYEQATPGYRQELARESFAAVQIALRLALDAKQKHAIEKESEIQTFMGAFAEASVYGALLLTDKAEKGIVTLPSVMRQDKGSDDEPENRRMRVNKNFDIVQLTNNNPQVKPQIYRKIQVKFKRHATEANTYAPDITVVYFREALVNALNRIQRDITLRKGMSLLAHPESPHCEPLWKALAGEIENQMVRSRIGKVS